MSYSRILKSKAGLQIATEDSGSNIVLAPNNGEIHLAGTAVLSNALGVAYGGTGATDASGARTALGITPANLSLVIGTDVQAQNAKLQDIADLAPSTGQHLEWNGANWVGALHDEEATTASGALEKTNNDITVKALGITNAMLAGSIEPSKLNSITVSKISDYLAQGAINSSNMFSAGVVDASALGADVVDGSKIADSAIDSEHIASGAVDASHLSGSIPVSKLSDYLSAGAISNSNVFGTAVVPNAALENDAVNGNKIADNSVDSEHIVAGAVDAGHLSADCVNGDKIADDAINSEHIASGAVDADHVNTSEVPTLASNNTFTGTNAFSGAVVGASANAWGDSRSLTYSVNTADNSKTTLASYTLGANECVLVEANVSARDQVSADVNAYKLHFLCKRASAASSAEFPAGASQDNLEIIHESDGTWNCEARANTTNGGFDVSVYGDASNSVHWACSMVVTRVA